MKDNKHNDYSILYFCVYTIMIVVLIALIAHFT